MGSKAFLYLGLLLAVVLLISSEVAAGDVAETSTDNKNVDATLNGVNDAKYGGYNGGYPGYGGGDHGGRGGDYPGGGRRGGDYPGGGRGRGRCYHGCCRWSYYGRECQRCCSYAGEAVEAKTEAKPHN
ncbi:Glycine rich protein [Parasponia andersonii]|uniref:Glycine rich protein n=1 Tax=Parasponia andersonii TaxID=3476 RepID=A0A2P5BI59_PARAD|nr:Glycine rich protein [Parasponia andersonii]